MLRTISLGLVLSAFLALSFSSVAAPINGAGATFPYPLYSKWFFEYQKKFPDVQINYQSIGSGGGIKQLQEKTVDFGATDAPMSNEELAKAKGPVIHVPTVLGAVVVTYNLPGATGKSLRLTADLVADLFLGKLENWNHPRLVELNPWLQNIKDSILVARRADGSGTTSIFTDYLAKVSLEWKQKVGAGKQVNWPVGLGGKGNEGVAGLIKQTPGSVGYVELIYAKNNGLPVASIKNAAGAFVTPNLESVTAAAAEALSSMPEDFRVSITNPPGVGAYPISGFTYLLIYRDSSKEKGGPLVQFLRWAVQDGQSYASALGYAPLPKALVKKVEARIAEVQLK